jgi:hypothetical protein
MTEKYLNAPSLRDAAVIRNRRCEIAMRVVLRFKERHPSPVIVTHKDRLPCCSVGTRE